MSLSTMDRTTRQKSNKELEDLKNARLNRNLQNMPSHDNRKHIVFNST